MSQFAINVSFFTPSKRKFDGLKNALFYRLCIALIINLMRMRSKSGPLLTRKWATYDP